jgi:predicted ATP-grasp superfamily ATP-dependent carboligase
MKSVMPRDLPAALIIGGNLNALSICRSLAPQGIRTYVLESQRFQPASWSRHARSIRAEGMYGDGLIRALRRLPPDIGPKPVLIITNEMSLLTLSERRAEIAERFRLSLPSHKTLLALQDKVLFHQFAVAHDLPVPKSVILHDDDDLYHLRKLRFPVIIKPADKRHVHMRRAPRLVKALGYGHAIDASRALLRSTRGNVIAQEHVDGPDSNIFFTLFYRSDDQTVTFTGQKLASSPPGTGSTAFCVQVDGKVRETLEMATQQFLDTVPDYRGFGSVEYKWDKEAKRWIIIEPTVGRTDWQEEIAPLLGINLLYAGYLCECRLPVPEMQLRNENVIWQASFIERLKVGLPTRPADAKVIDGFWRSDDPLPAIVHYPSELFFSLPSLVKSLVNGRT